MNQKSTYEVFEKLYSENGLTDELVKSQFEKYGENTFKRKSSGAFKIFIGQFFNPLTFILIFAGVVSLFMGNFSDACVILGIILLNSLLSFVQEYRSNKAVEKLSSLVKKNTLVIRCGKPVVLSYSELVPGDTVILKGGDIVPADVKIKESYDLWVNESQVFGESAPVSKTEDSVLFSGSVIGRGRCKCVVVATGNFSSLGRIARLSADTKKVTPYQKSLSQFSVSLLKIICISVVLMLTAKFFIFKSDDNFVEVLIFAVALALTVVPEALPMVTTITLSSGAIQMAKHKVIVKRLPAIETLGRINILCTDKTGTLTQDRLTVNEIESENSELLLKFAYASIEDKDIKNCQNSFDGAFLKYIKPGVKRAAANLKLLFEVPFEPGLRRRRAVIYDSLNNKTYLVCIGAPETIIGLCQKKDYFDVYSRVKLSGGLGMRLLCYAYKEIKYFKGFNALQSEKDLIYLGFATLYDPLRKTAKNTIKLAKSLGIEVKILTGDSLEAAVFTGRKTGLLKTGDIAHTGDELEKMDSAELLRTLQNCSVFARVTPEQKYMIIQKLKVNNVVGYQGDGINDAPSLKLADAAIAVHNATEVAKDSADIVLLEDDLQVIINGIRYGRSIFVNINKYIKHTMVGNIGNFFSMLFFYVVFAANIPMLAVQLLIGNIIQDMPLMTVFSDSIDDSEGTRPQTFADIKPVMKTSLILGAFTAVFYLLFFLYVGTNATPFTMATLFLFYNFTQLLIIISVRSKKHFFWQGAKPSKLLLFTIVAFMAVSVILVYVPVISSFLGFAPLPFPDFIILILITAAYILLLDLIKVIIGRFKFAN